MIRDAKAESKSKWPVYNSLEEALCYKCSEKFDSVSQASGYANGSGEYVGSCEKCHTLTWFDVSPIEGKIWERTHGLCGI